MVFRIFKVLLECCRGFAKGKSYKIVKFCSHREGPQFSFVRYLVTGYLELCTSWVTFMIILTGLFFHLKYLKPTKPAMAKLLVTEYVLNSKFDVFQCICTFICRFIYMHLMRFGTRGTNWLLGLYFYFLYFCTQKSSHHELISITWDFANFFYTSY